MNKTSLMHSAERPRKRYRDTQKLRYVQRSAEQAIEGGTPRTLEHQRRAGVVPRQRDGPRRPAWIELGPQRVFTFEPLDRLKGRMFSQGHDQQDRIETIPTASIQREFAFLQNREHVTGKFDHSQRSW